jgi:hypothetical protein
MKSAVLKSIAIFVICAIFLAGCATMVRIDSNVPGARVTVNDEFIGNAPAQTSLSDFDFNNYDVVISADGYRAYHGQLRKEFKVGAFVGGLFLLFPWLWVYGPSPYQTFEIEKQQ